VDALAKPLIAVPAKVDLEDLAGLIADRSGSRYALEADFAKKPGAEFFSHPRKRTKEVAIEMLAEEFLYL
jgi:hypothetical protein